MSWSGKVVLFALVAAAAAAGCRRCGGEGAPAPEPVDLRVDAPDLDYVFRAPDGQLRSAVSVSEIPPPLRGAVMVHHPTMTGSAPEHTVYVTDLLGAAPHDTVTARPITRDDYARRTADLRGARRTAELVRIAALELTGMHPNSKRSAAADEARETFDEILPRLRSPDAGNDADTDAGRSPDTTEDTHASPPRTSP